MSRLTVIVASSGRLTLHQTLHSLTPQMQPGDELLLSVNNDAPWGHAARNKLMARATGDGLLFMDDDDIYAEGALQTARAALSAQPDALHIFRMRYADGSELWQDQEIREGNVSTQMVCVPNMPEKRGWWGDRYEGDFDFISSTAALLGAVSWHSDVIALIKP